jgi:hypothetical protein
MAQELQDMFLNADEPVAWDSKAHHVRCYAHKLNLTVGHGLRVLGQKVSTAKPAVPQGVPLPIPTLEVNAGEDGIQMDESESDEEDGEGLPEKPDGVDDEEIVSEETVGNGDDLVAQALMKVSDSFLIQSLYFDSI